MNNCKNILKLIYISIGTFFILMGLSYIFGITTLINIAVAIVVLIEIYLFSKYSKCLMSEIKKSGHENEKIVIDEMGHSA